MDRRTFLSTAGTLAAGALAGCLSSSTAPADGDGDGGSPTSTATPTATPAPAVADTSFTVESVGPGSGENDARISFEDGVAVDGTIRGNNGCYTASLGSVSVEAGTLTVTVRSHEKEGSGACTQAIVDIEYGAHFTFEGPLPDRVVVEHRIDGKTKVVADAKR